MNDEAMVQLYSSKTDDELLVLSAEIASLRDEAKSVLADELRRRNLTPSLSTTNESRTATALHSLSRVLSG